MLKALGLSKLSSGTYLGNGEWSKTTDAGVLQAINPSTDEVIGEVYASSASDYETIVKRAQAAFETWRKTPAPRRGEAVRLCGDALRKHKDALGSLVALEMGKIKPEGDGEVQEMIDIADFAVGQSRMLYGLSMHSERPLHAMREQWHPLGTVGIITAFNFPVAVWAWNSMLAYVCGDACLWKPSSLTPLCAIGMTNVVRPVLEAEGLGGLATLCVGSGREVGNRMLEDPRLPLISFTGSTSVGKRVAQTVAARFGRTILELGGNNAIVVMDDADVELAMPAILFGSVGTAGQRCTTTRRLLVHEKLAPEIEKRLLAAYAGVKIGDPSSEGTLCGPLVDASAVEEMQAALKKVVEEGGKVLCGGGRPKMSGELGGGYFVEPAIVRAENHYATVQQETFAPILYLIRVKDIDDAIAKHNAVPQGLSSSIFTMNVRHAERFMSATGSDCGIANVNIGTSGAEIGGAFGGEKETGGGRESGSDSWKAYMRRQTSTVNYGRDLPLAQGIVFG